MDTDTSKVIYAAPRDSLEQGIHLSPEEDTAKPMVFGGYLREEHELRTCLLENQDNNAINLELNADTIFPDRVYLKRWKDPGKVDSRRIKVKEYHREA